ncbi:MAG: peptide deformylase [Streptococcaceae bacterium]|jgi:peptide deformylase|nr:peptide deformylase [Streptococcaceae bacterium]MCH4176315.1 peptide deformylase [Streptococcaceae bacterium]
MSTLENLIQADHKIDMADIIREGNPTLRAVAEPVDLPLSADLVKLGDKMLEFLINSQDAEIAEELGLRGGVGLAAPQLDLSIRVIAVHVPSADPEISTPQLSTVMYNPKVVSHSVIDACLADGEGCLSVDREVPGYVVRHARLTVKYTTQSGEEKTLKLKGYQAIVVQHELDHINGILFYDHINSEAPFSLADGVQIIE